MFFQSITETKNGKPIRSQLTKKTEMKHLFFCFKQMIEYFCLQISEINDQSKYFYRRITSKESYLKNCNVHINHWSNYFR